MLRDALTAEEVTLVSGAIHNPAEPRHFMVIKPVHRRVRVLFEGTVIAETTEALRLLEVGKDLYDPALYLPREALKVPVRPSEHATYCPLKGDAGYLDVIGDEGKVIAPNLAWTYAKPFSFAKAITDRVSFYADRVTMEEAPL